MKINIILLLLFMSITILGQNTFDINLKITDTIIVKKKYPYATKINVEIDISDFKDTLFLYHFNKYVSPAFFISDLKPLDTNYIKGLIYIVEDINNHIIEPEVFLVSYKYPEEEIRSLNKRIFVSSKQKIENRLLNEQEQHDYDKSEYVIISNKQKLVLYPLLHHNNLPKGEYYLYLVYSFNPNMYLQKHIVNDSKTFKGRFVSNKVRLIVK